MDQPELTLVVAEEELLQLEVMLQELTQHLLVLVELEQQVQLQQVQ